MNKDFKLYKAQEKLFPQSLIIEEQMFTINPDFRNILRIFAILNDERLTTVQRYDQIFQWFFQDPAGVAAIVTFEEAFNIIMGFIRPTPKENNILDETCDRDEPAAQSSQFDYDFDAEEIYISFLQAYNIDIIETDFLHWYKFKSLLLNLPHESALNAKLRLRDIDISKYHGAEYLKMKRAKLNAQLPIKYTQQEIRQIEEFTNQWDKV
jgi:hypothetical protein